MMALVKAVARATGFRPWVVIAAVVVLALGTGLLAKCGYDRAVVSHAVTKATNTSLKKQTRANDVAADEQVSDIEKLRQIEKDFSNAIHNPQPCDPPDPGVRLACQQLRTDDYREADLPAPCRCPRSGDGQTPRDP
ncbi:MAG: hypothetical protein KDE63_01210 [Novosphingobium sp.]|nr:hypothetical protein [Novosphingobium sp.]